MINADLTNNIKTMMRRYERHLESGNHALRAGSQQEIGHSFVEYFREKDPVTHVPPTYGSVVAPGGLGKTIVGGDFIVGINTLPSGRFVLDDVTLGKRVLITVPTNQLVDQWADRLIGEYNEETGQREPSVFGDRFTEKNVGVYHADLSDEKKREALAKPVVIAVHDSVSILSARDDQKSGDKPSLEIKDFDAVFLDEVDEKVRGDKTRRFYKENVFPSCLAIGVTASPYYKNGRSIMDYLFGGKKPICEITHLESVERKEIAGHVNIIVEPEIDPSSIIQPKTDFWGDYTETEQLRLIEQTGTDQALLETIKVGLHPITGKPLRDMMQMHQAVNVEHAKHIAKQYNKAFGKGYAEAVWGATDEEMDKEMRRLAKWFFVTGEIKMLVQCKLLGRGTDFPALEMTVQHPPTLSPNKLLQFHTRASRRHDGYKKAIYLSPFIRGIDQLVIGEVLGGLIMLPQISEFSATEGRNRNPSMTLPWPDIKGVIVHQSERQLAMFAEQRHRQRHINGLPVKQKHMMSCEEMAAVIGVEPGIFRERVFAPLIEAFEKREARQKFVNIDAGQPDEVLHVRGKMFPVRRIGFYRDKTKEVFCVDQNAAGLCEHTLYGRLDRARPELLSRDTVRRLLGANEEQMGELWQKLQQAFFNRKPYEQRVVVGDAEFRYDSFGFYKNPTNATEFYLSADALLPAHKLLFTPNQETVDKWASRLAVKQCKTSDWLTITEVMDALEINPILAVRPAARVREIFANVQSEARGLHPGNESVMTIGKNGNKFLLPYAKRWLPLAAPAEQTALCVHESSLEWFKSRLGMENAYSAGAQVGRNGPSIHASL